MDAEQIRQLEPQLAAFLDRFGDCFTRRDTRAHFPVYVRGQLSELRARAWNRWRWQQAPPCGRCKSS